MVCSGGEKNVRRNTRCRPRGVESGVEAQRNDLFILMISMSRDPFELLAGPTAINFN